MEKIILDKDNSFKKCRKGFSILGFVFSPLFVIIVMLIAQIALLVVFFDLILESDIYWIALIVNLIAIIYIVNENHIGPYYKISWLLIFTMLPVFGIMFYVYFYLVNRFNIYNRRLRDICLNAKKYYVSKVSDEEKKFIIEKSVDGPLANYLYNFAGFPVYNDNETKYFPDGKSAFEDIFEKMQNAKKFIFIEIFILSDGIIWEEMLKILKEKAKEGVEVRLMFDGFNSISSFRSSYCKELAKYGIKAKQFNPIVPLVTTMQNNRSHRKIFVIDNEVAYTGGINIADEYANLYERFGYWKDVAIRLIGSAVESFTIMFLELWNADEKTDIPDYDKYAVKKDFEIKNTDSYVAPFTDYPALSEFISATIISYMSLNSKKYFYVTTPYLVIDDSMLESLEGSAKLGVDVRIIVPHIQDKKYVYLLNRSYYARLTKAGVKVYEYLPGFIHAKTYVSDDIRAMVGTTNLDYRSLYLHYENGLYIYNDKTVLDVKKDFEETLKDCKLMDFKEISSRSAFEQIASAILRMFAPFM